MIRAAEVAISVSGVFCLGKRNEKNTIKGSTLYTEGFVSDCERPVIFGLLPLKDIRTGCLPNSRAPYEARFIWNISRQTA